MKARCTLKFMNWQDVTMEQLSSHWEDMEKLKGFELARYKNAYAYGDIAGCGIDIRCQYSDEVVDVYIHKLKSRDIETKLRDLDWKTTRYTDTILQMEKESDIVIFDICSNDDVGYMTMNITNEYADTCNTNLMYYYERGVAAIRIEDKIYNVYEHDVEFWFRDLCARYFDKTEYAGADMRNLNVGNDIVQVYPFDITERVYIIMFKGYDEDGNGINEDVKLIDLPFEKQIEYLKLYNDTLSGEKQNENKGDLEVLAELKKQMESVENENNSQTKFQKTIDKTSLEQRFIDYCESNGAECYRNESMGTNGKNREIIYCTNMGIVYYYFDNNGDYEMPTMQTISYPMPSELLVEGITSYLLNECLNAGMGEVIKEIGEFVSKTDTKKDEIGVPHAYFYGWVWEDGKWDEKAKYEKIIFHSQEKEKDCEYLKAIYPMLKDGWHIDCDGTPNHDCTTQNMVGNDAQFCTYYLESGLNLQEFLAQYDDLSRKDSLWSKCNEFADYLVKTYLGADGNNDMRNELAKVMNSYIVSKKGVSYFPKNDTLK